MFIMAHRTSIHTIENKVSYINKDVRNIIDRIIWKWKIKKIHEEYDKSTCIHVPNISNKIYSGCRSIGYNQRKVNYRILKPFMRDPDVFIRSVRLQDRRRVNDFLPDKLLGSIPPNYTYTSTTYLRILRRSFKEYNI